MDDARLLQWLDETKQRLTGRGAQVQLIQGDGASMDPDIVLDLESEAITASIGIWTSLREAELHAVSMNVEGPLLLEHVSLADSTHDLAFRPVTELFEH